MAELKEKKKGNLSLLREKSVIVDKSDGSEEGQQIETIRSNRCVFSCGDDIVVVRTRFMHLALRLGALIHKNYHFKGPLFQRDETIDWAQFWLDSQSAFDKEFDRIGWCQIYINGESVYSTHHSAYIDVIEKCSSKGSVYSYDETLGVTERHLAEKGQKVEIIHCSTVATTIKEEKDAIRMGLIHRGGRKDTIFSISVNHEPHRAFFHQVMDMAADFTEAINMTHEFEVVKKKQRLSASLLSPSELHYARSCRDRRAKVERMITVFESAHSHRYRPDKPVFGSPSDYSL